METATLLCVLGIFYSINGAFLREVTGTAAGITMLIMGMVML